MPEPGEARVEGGITIACGHGAHRDCVGKIIPLSGGSPALPCTCPCHPDAPPTPQSTEARVEERPERAHDFDPGCNCGACLWDKGYRNLDAPADPSPQSTEARADSCPSCGSTDPDTCRSSADPRRRPDGHGHPMAMRDKDWRKGGLMVDDSRFCCRDSFHEPASPSPQSTEARVPPLAWGDGFGQPASPPPQSTEARVCSCETDDDHRLPSARSERLRDPRCPVHASPQSTPEDREITPDRVWHMRDGKLVPFVRAASADEARARADAVPTLCVLVAHFRAGRDKARAERDEARRDLEIMEGDRDDAVAQLKATVIERDEARAELERLRGALEEVMQDRYCKIGTRRTARVALSASPTTEEGRVDG